MKKTPKGIKITPVVEVTYEIVDDDCEIPVRTIKEYTREDGVVIGKIDILDQFDKILSESLNVSSITK